jgi:peroxiredoxin Q/BCP
MREFRALHDGFAAAGVTVAGVSTERAASNRAWSERLALPYPLLADPDKRAGDAFGVVRRIGIGGWSVELFARTTLLADADGIVQAVWGKVRIRGHGREVLEAARVLARPR